MPTLRCLSTISIHNFRSNSLGEPVHEEGEHGVHAHAWLQLRQRAQQRLQRAQVELVCNGKLGWCELVRPVCMHTAGPAACPGDTRLQGCKGTGRCDCIAKHGTSWANWLACMQRLRHRLAADLESPRYARAKISLDQRTSIN